MRSPFSLKSAHLLMWSSPLLLLVLVFTLTLGSAPNAPVASSPPPSSTSPVTTVIPSTTTTFATRATIPTIVVAKTTETTRTTLSTTSVEKSYSSATTTTVKPVAPIPNANALSGALSGTLEPGFETVDVPLLGPGDWTLTASAPTTQTLNCGGDTSPVASQVVVGSNQDCQLEIASTSDGTSTWQLTPNT